jgi:hypothetical protein
MDQFDFSVRNTPLFLEVKYKKQFKREYIEKDAKVYKEYTPLLYILCTQTKEKPEWDIIFWCFENDLAFNGRLSKHEFLYDFLAQMIPIFNEDKDINITLRHLKECFNVAYNLLSQGLDYENAKPNPYSQDI